MPHPKGHLKLSGDVHLPDAESDLDVEEGTSGLSGLAADRRQPRGAATRVRRAGMLRSGDEPERGATSQANASNAQALGRGDPQAGVERGRRGWTGAADADAGEERGPAMASRARRWMPWAMGAVAALVVYRLVR